MPATIEPLAASLHGKVPIATNVASTTSQREIFPRICAIYFFVLHRRAKLAKHCAMEPDYFESFKQLQWLSIFVVHKIQLQPHCIMESVNGSLNVVLWLPTSGGLTVVVSSVSVMSYLLPCVDQQLPVLHLLCCSCNSCPRNQLAAALFVKETLG